MEAWFRLSCRGDAYYIHEALAVIDIHAAGSTTRTAGSAERAEGLQQLLDSYDRLRQAGLIPVAAERSCRRFMEHQRGRLALHLCRAGRRRAALTLLLTAVPPGSHTWRDYRDVIRSALRFHDW